MPYPKTALAIAAVLAGLLPAQELPEGKGKDTAQRLCATCHEMETVVSTRRTKTEWQLMINDMASRGADGSAAEMTEVLNYLTASFGKTNVNTASAAELEKSLDLPEADAQAIVAYREKIGKFQTFADLEKTPGVDAAKLGARRSKIAFSE